MKYSYRCLKIAHNSEQEAWEYVIHSRRQNKGWTEPYLCKCGKYHTTGKHFHYDRVPSWVKQLANDKGCKAKRKQGRKDVTLSLRKQRQAIAKLPKVQPEPSWKRTIKKLLQTLTGDKTNGV